MLPKLHHKLSRIQLRYNKIYKTQRSEKTIRDVDSRFIYYAFQAIIDGGRIAVEGKPAELLESSALYRSLQQA